MNIVWTKRDDEFSERVKLKGHDSEILCIDKFQIDDAGVYQCAVFNLDSNGILNNFIEVDIKGNSFTNNYEFSVVNTPVTPYLHLGLLETLQETERIEIIKARCSSTGKFVFCRRLSTQQKIIKLSLIKF